MEIKETTVGELRQALNDYQDEDSVIVSLFKKDKTTVLFEVEGIADNAGLQINVYEEGAERDYLKKK